MLSYRSTVVRMCSLAVITLGLFAACANGPTVPSGEGRIVWEVPGNALLNILPAFDGNAVYFATANHELVALSKIDGALRWRASTGVPGPYTAGTSVALAKDVAVIADIDVYAFDRASGTRRWIFRAGDDDETGNWLATDGDAVYAPSLWGRLYKIDAANGALLWRTVLPGSTASGASTIKSFHPTIYDGTVYVGFQNFGTNPKSGGLVAVDVATGSIKWVRNFEPGYPGASHGSLGGAIQFGTAVITFSRDGRVYSLDAATGAVRWVAPWLHQTPTPTQLGSYGDDRYLGVIGSMVVATSGEGIWVGLDVATGLERWRRQTSMELWSVKGPFVTTDGTSAFLTTASGEVLAVDPMTGNSIWRFGGPYLNVPGKFSAPPVVDGSRLYVAGHAGFYALRN